MSSLDKKTVEKIAKLASLELTDYELEKFSKQLSEVIDYNVDQLSKVDTDKVEPLLHPSGLTNSAVEDIPEPSIPTKDVLKNAPDKHNDFFTVKQILDQS